MTIVTKADVGRMVIVTDNNLPVWKEVVEIMTQTTSDKTKIFYKVGSWSQWINEDKIFLEPEDLISLVEKLKNNK